MMEEKEDLTVSGPGSPISLNKFMASEHYDETKEFMMLIDGTASGIAKDAPGVMYITADECSKQAIYYSHNVFNGVAIPLYLYRYLSYMMLDKEMESKAEFHKAFPRYVVAPDDQDYVFIRNLIKYAENNPEAQQIIGLIQLTSGIINLSRKSNAGVKVYFEHPETHLHPKRQSKLVTLLNTIKEDFS